MRNLVIIVVVAFILAACQPGTSDSELPTLAVLPSVTATETTTPTQAPSNTPEPSNTPQPSETAEDTATTTLTRIPSETPTPSETPDSTQVVIGTSTAAVLEAPRFATFTPLPPGVIAVVRPTSTGTPQVVADVIITEPQFQEEMNRLVEEMDAVNRARVDFVEGAISVEITALGGEAFVTGSYAIPFDFRGGSLNNIFIARPVSPEQYEMEGDVEVSEEFLTSSNEATLAVYEALNFILNQRLGEGNHDLEFIQITEDVIGISLLVPEPGSP